MHDGRWRRPACPPAPGGPVLCWCQCACRPRCQFRLKPAPSVPTPTLPVLSLHCAQVFVSGGEEGLCHSLSIASNGKARSTLLLWRGSFCTPALWSFSHRPSLPHVSLFFQIPAPHFTAPLFPAPLSNFIPKVCRVKAMVFLVVMYRCESSAIKKAERQRTDAFKLWYWRRLLRVPWTARRSNWSIRKEISPEYSLEGLMLKLNLQYFTT